MDFQPNVIAQGLAKRKKFRICCLLLNDFPEWWGQIHGGFEKAAQELSEFGVETSTLWYSLRQLNTQEIGILSMVQNDEVDGIIMVPSIHREIIETLELAKEKNIPVVCINADAQLQSQRLFYYGPNEERVGEMAGELLGKLMGGKGNMCMIGVESNDFYRLALRKKGLINQLCRYYPNINILQGYSFPYDKLFSYTRETIQPDHDQISAIYVYDSIALEAVGKTLQDMGIHDIIVVGHECLGTCRELITGGWIDAVLCQETIAQGYHPLKLLYHYLLTGNSLDPFYYSNVNIVLRSNLDMLDKNENGCGFQ